MNETNDVLSTMDDSSASFERPGHVLSHLDDSSDSSSESDANEDTREMCLKTLIKLIQVVPVNISDLYFDGKILRKFYDALQVLMSFNDNEAIIKVLLNLFSVRDCRDGLGLKDKFCAFYIILVYIFPQISIASLHIPSFGYYKDYLKIIMVLSNLSSTIGYTFPSEEHIKFICDSYARDMVDSFQNTQRGLSVLRNPKLYSFKWTPRQNSRFYKHCRKEYDMLVNSFANFFYEKVSTGEIVYDLSKVRHNNQLYRIVCSEMNKLLGVLESSMSHGWETRIDYYNTPTVFVNVHYEKLGRTKAYRDYFNGGPLVSSLFSLYECKSYIDINSMIPGPKFEHVWNSYIRNISENVNIGINIIPFVDSNFTMTQIPVFMSQINPDINNIIFTTTCGNVNLSSFETLIQKIKASPPDTRETKIVVHEYIKNLLALMRWVNPRKNTISKICIITGNADCEIVYNENEVANANARYLAEFGYVPDIIYWNTNRSASVPIVEFYTDCIIGQPKQALYALYKGLKVNSKFNYKELKFFDERYINLRSSLDSFLSSIQNDGRRVSDLSVKRSETDVKFFISQLTNCFRLLKTDD